MYVTREIESESHHPAFWPHLKFIGLSFLQTASPLPAMLAYDLCQITLIEVDVDEEFYLASYPDIGRLLAAGHELSPKQHYIRTGFFEGRPPFRIAVDTSYYLDTNPDVKFAIDNGRIESAQAHFDLAGWKEGRSPSSGFSLLRARSGP